MPTQVFFQKVSAKVKPFGCSRTIQGMGNIESDDEGLWALFDRHRDRVFRHAYRLSGNRHDADDILATSFLELWRRRSKVRLVEGSLLPWLLVTTTNVARNSGRTEFRYRKLLNSLNALDLQLVSLVVFEEYTIAAAAAVLNLTPAAAKSRMHRARERMKKAIIGPQWPTPALEGDRS